MRLLLTSLKLVSNYTLFCCSSSLWFMSGYHFIISPRTDINTLEAIKSTKTSNLSSSTSWTRSSYMTLPHDFWGIPLLISVKTYLSFLLHTPEHWLFVSMRTPRPRYSYSSMVFSAAWNYGQSWMRALVGKFPFICSDLFYEQGHHMEQSTSEDWFTKKSS